MTKQKQMLGGCVVCLDEQGWTENPLVYCDGDGCNVAVHKNCYGITEVNLIHLASGRNVSADFLTLITLNKE